MGLRLFLLVACVCALAEARKFKEHNPPQYLQAYYSYTNATEELKRLLVPKFSPYVPVTDPTRHYVLLVAVLQNVSEALSSRCPPPYDKQYYEAVDKVVGNAFAYPVTVTNRQLELVDKIYAAVENVVKFFNTSCAGLSESQCNQKVEDVVHDHPEEYRHAAKTLLVAGDFSKVYLNNTYETESYAYDVLNVLVTGKDEFKKLATSGAAVLSLLNDPRPKDPPNFCASQQE